MSTRSVRSAMVIGGLAAMAALLPATSAHAATAGPETGWATWPTRPYVLASSVTWSANALATSSDAGSRPVSVQVRVSKTPTTATHRSSWTYPSRLQHVGLLSSGKTARFSVGIVQGQASCVQARAYDAAGRAGAWGPVDCIVRFLGDASLEHRGRVRQVRAKRFWGGTASEIDGGGQLVVRHVPKGSQVWVLGRPAPLGSTADWGTTPRVVGMNAAGTGQVVLGQNGGVTVGRHMWLTDRVTRRLGPVWLRPDREATFPIEGVAILPPWVYSRS